MNVTVSHLPRADAPGSRNLAVTQVTDAAAWAALMAAAPFPHLPQDFAYGEGKRASGWTVRRVIFQRGEHVLAFATVLQRHVLGFPVVTRVNRGPVFLTAYPTEDDAVAVYDALRRRFPGPLLIAPALPMGTDGDSILQRAGFRRRHNRGWISGRIDLRPSEPELWASFTSTFRNRVRKSQSLGATLRIANDAASYDWMIDRHLENMAQKRFKGIDATFLRAMRLAAPDNVSVFQLIYEGQPIAGMSVVSFQRCAEYHIGWFGPEGRRLNAGNFLMWEIVKHLKARGIAEFDVGGLGEGDGYTRFKQTMRPQEYSLAGEWMPAWIPWRAQ